MQLSAVPKLRVNIDGDPCVVIPESQKLVCPVKLARRSSTNDDIIAYITGCLVNITNKIHNCINCIPGKAAAEYARKQQEAEIEDIRKHSRIEMTPELEEKLNRKIERYRNYAENHRIKAMEYQAKRRAEKKSGNIPHNTRRKKCQ